MKNCPICGSKPIRRYYQSTFEIKYVDELVCGCDTMPPDLVKLIEVVKELHSQHNHFKMEASNAENSRMIFLEFFDKKAV